MNFLDLVWQSYQDCVFLGCAKLACNMQGISALTSGVEPCLLAVPSQTDMGSIRICSAADSNHVVAEVDAHKSRLVGMRQCPSSAFPLIHLSFC